MSRQGSGLRVQRLPEKSSTVRPATTRRPQAAGDWELERRRVGLGVIGRTGAQPAELLLGLQRAVGNSTALRLLDETAALPARVQRQGGQAGEYDEDEDGYEDYEDEDEEVDEEAAQYLWRDKPAPTVWGFAPPELHDESFKAQELKRRERELTKVQNLHQTRRRDVRNTANASLRSKVNSREYGHLGNKDSSRRFERQGELARDRELADLETATPAQAQSALVPRVNTALTDLGQRRTRVTAATNRGNALTGIAVADPALALDVATLANLAARLNATFTDCQNLQHRMTQGTLPLPARFEGSRLADRAAALVSEVDLAAPAIEGRLTVWEGQHQQVLTAAASYPNLKLTVAIMGAANGPHVFGAPELAALNTKAAGSTVLGWVTTYWPASRNPRPIGVPNPVLLPNLQITVNNVDPSIDPSGTATLTVGPEILIDWMYPNPAHGLSFRELQDRAKSVLDTQNRIFKMFKPEVVPSNHNWKVAARNYAFQLILNGAKNMIITYYQTS